MLKIFLVDDGTLTLKDMKHTFPWNENGFCVAGYTANAQESLKLCERLTPDIIIVALKQGEGNRLKLIQAFRKMRDTVKIIIVSECREFEYVHRALNNKVVAYILKPFENKELLDVLNEIKKDIETNRQNAQIIKDYMVHRNEKIFMDLFKGNIPSENVASELAKLNIEVPKRTYSLAIIRAVDDGKQVDEKIFSDIIDCEIMQNMNFVIRHNLNSLTTVLVIFIKRHYEFHNGCMPVERIADSFSKEAEGNVYAAVSNSFNDISEISTAFEQASKVLENNIFMNRKKVGYYAEIDRAISTAQGLSTTEFDEIFQSIKSDGVRANEIIDEYFDKLRLNSFVDVSDIRHMVIDLYIFLAKFIIEDDGNMELIFGRKIHLMSEVWQIETLSGIKGWIKDIINDLCKAKNIIVPGDYSFVTQRAIEYIKKNYRKKVSVKYVADMCRVSDGYLMRNFKRETGKTFGEYLAEYRILVAKRLLAKGEYKIYEVSNMVGYKDSKYFCRVFKKLTQTSPSTESGRRR